MKYRIYILPLLLGPMSATAYELDLYYDLNGNYDTFCTTNYVGLGDCPNPVDQTAVAEKLMALAEERDEVLGDIKLSDGTTLINSNGEFQLTGTQVNAKGLDQTTTLQTNNECKSGNTKNKNGVCVNASALENPEGENVAYIDWFALEPQFNSNGVLVDFGGGEVAPDDIGGNDKACYYDRDFDIVIHWCPENYSAIDYSYGGAHIAYGNNPVDWSALPCNYNTETYHYHWNGGTSLGVYTQGGQTKTEIVFPTVPGWSPRGFYIVRYPEYKPNNSSFNNIPYYSTLKTVADNLVTEQTTTWGRARLGLPFNQTNVTDRIILNNKVNGYGDANANWQIWTCDGDITTVHMYAAWARDCDAKDGASCTLGIRRTGLYNSNNKGDAFYTTGCSGSNQTLVSGANTYHPVCSTNSASNCTSSQHFCYVGSAPQCVASGESSSACCNDNLGACNKESACCVVTGGTWNDTNSSCSGGNYTWNSGTCTAGGGSGGGNTPPETFTCPQTITMGSGSDLIVKYNASASTPGEQCVYNVTCPDNYTISSSQPYTCNNSTTCTATAIAMAIGQQYTCTPPATTLDCPGKSDFQLDDTHMSISAPTYLENNTKCRYTLSCTGDGYTLSPSSPNSVTCSGSSQCTVAGVKALISSGGYECSYSSTFSCPTVGTWDEHGTFNKKSSTSSSCTYEIKCHTGYQLYSGTTPSSSGTVTKTCTDPNCTPSWINGLKSTYHCEEIETFTCPTAPIIGHGTITKTDGENNSCGYSLECSTGYAVPDPELDTTYTCTGDDCASGVTNWARYLECKQQFDCPSPASIEHGSISKKSTNNGTACLYTVNCHTPAYTCTLNGNQCDGYTCEDVSLCNTWLSTINNVCEFECPSKSYLESKLPHMNVQGLLTTNPLYDCQYTLGTCDQCYNRAHTGANVLYCSGEDCNGTSWYSGADTCTWVGGDGCSSMAQ